MYADISDMVYLDCTALIIYSAADHSLVHSINRIQSILLVDMLKSQWLSQSLIQSINYSMSLPVSQSVSQSVSQIVSDSQSVSQLDSETVS